MDREQLKDHYSTLVTELSAAYEQRPWRSDRIDLLADSIHAAETVMAGLQTDEQCDDPFPYVLAAQHAPQAQAQAQPRDEGA